MLPCKAQTSSSSPTVRQLFRGSRKSSAIDMVSSSASSRKVRVQDQVTCAGVRHRASARTDCGRGAVRRALARAVRAPPTHLSRCFPCVSSARAAPLSTVRYRAKAIRFKLPQQRRQLRHQPVRPRWSRCTAQCCRRAVAEQPPVVPE